MKKPLAALLGLSLSCAALAAPFPDGNAETGKKLFAQYDCSHCHVAMLGGDGSAIFTRPNHKVRSPQQMIGQMKACSAAANITLSPSDEQHLAAYLNQQYYRFK